MGMKTRQKSAIYIVTLAILLIILVLTVGTEQDGISLIKIKNSEDLSEFLSSLGWECNLTELTTQETTLPQQFDDTFIAYNAIQLKQNCDLTKYAGKTVTVYIVPITNYTGSTDPVLATVLVYKGKVIGGDLHSATMDGFMHGLR